MKRPRHHLLSRRLTVALLLASFAAVGFLCCEREHESSGDEEHHHHLLADDAPALPSVKAAPVLDDPSRSAVASLPDTVWPSGLREVRAPHDLPASRALYLEHASLLI